MIPLAIVTLSTQQEQIDPHLTLGLCKRPKTTLNDYARAWRHGEVALVLRPASVVVCEREVPSDRDDHLRDGKQWS
jgi:hypothetical protein